MNLQKAPSTNALRFRDKASEVSRLMKGSAINQIKTGRILMEVQQGFKGIEGAFLDWIDYNFHLEKRTAYRWIEKAKKFEGWGMLKLENMHPTALMLIANTKCPDEITQAALLQHSRAPITDPSGIKEIMREHDTQKSKGEGKGIDRQRTARHIINYIDEIEPSRYTHQEMLDIKTAWGKKLG